MSMFLTIIFIILFVELAKSDNDFDIITAQKFLDGQSLCTDSSLKSQVKSICVTLSLKENPHWGASKVKKNSGCQDGIIVYLQDIQGFTGPRTRNDVGICRLSDDVTKCVTRGEGPKDVYVYDYNGEVCYLQLKQTLHKCLKISSGGFFSGFFSWCNFF